MEALQRKTYGLKNEMSDTVLFQIANSVLYNLEQKLSSYKIGFFILLLCVAMTAMGFVFYIYY